MGLGLEATQAGDSSGSLKVAAEREERDVVGVGDGAWP